ncbi:MULTISPECIES: hypothetical protein [Pseudomonas]|nr:MULTISPECIES: hypothetical protein [Pseudomonas]MBB4815651.1 hypothetical protein [Pseudomonas rhodesiae]MDN6866258.1 hypothetical protein [Pseudomonas rhodesiae]
MPRALALNPALMLAFLGGQWLLNNARYALEQQPCRAQVQGEC